MQTTSANCLRKASGAVEAPFQATTPSDETVIGAKAGEFQFKLPSESHGDGAQASCLGIQCCT
eukprot:4944030-Amphidinium_carterae.1